MRELHIVLRRETGGSLVDQIATAIGLSIRQGTLYAGARLPSWRDLAIQLGVARGTVRAAYERLIDEQLIVSQGAAGTFVAQSLPVHLPPDIPTPRNPLPEIYQHPFGEPPRVFQVGVPAQDGFPGKLWSRVAAQVASEAAVGMVSYPDPRGELPLRTEIAAYLSVARGMSCSPAQIVITSGYSGALGLLVHALELKGKAAWLEDPGYPLSRMALAMAGMTPVPVPVTAEGLDVEEGIARAGDAALAIVTAGQQAPLGMTLSLARRHRLLEWAASGCGWIVEDDYLSELQLTGRAAPALASLDRHGRVIYVGTFSKTIRPGLRLGFMVLPPALVERVGEVAAALAPAGSVANQLALAEFMRKGHYLRHLRKMKRLYRARAAALQQALPVPAEAVTLAGLALLLRLPVGCDDRAIAHRAEAFGLTPAPLSVWYADPARARPGLLLGITNLPQEGVEACCAHLMDLIGHQEDEAAS
ncbi:HTH-type transcriptional regulatory protein GabR [Aeromonas dhakensis]|uniref:MocR-like pyridoxine biosynthesis transcription factor PdxR n=1 Tax=Aeromonas dhakensis TaxID=196024 RepID=UPI000E3CCF4D|nr:PLP-dependent aminotransferase family protein [Aeromonas dhakensis]QXA15523.1 PLP-dependent aminotransferase family protein [Aeromonas sp. FDAARGOS 1403]RFS28330.1 PLP-dependent aminotransferase family protein [Aeromonas dhakensis]HDT5886199.1 PLP-dependent aminotransferase family protein [Aeromonas dhakensis]HDX8366522.1 PLP-dependent aminotransferase family protein [Aeromonas dhakensis]HDX8373884.1 PLP-dependent aminotransferase family protein [Aeromonas dhakensis]